MPFPAGVQLATLTFGNPVTFLGSDTTRTELTIQSTADVVWAADGVPIDNFPERMAPQEGAPGFLTAPYVDQDGFTDQAGNAFKNWAYILTRTTFFNGQSKQVRKTWQPKLGQTEVDFDKLPGGTIGLPVAVPIPPVTSVAGLTSAVAAEELAGALLPFIPTDVTPESVAAALPPRLSEESLSATIVNQSKTADALALDQAMAFAARPQPLSRWRNKLATDPANAKIVGMGDSTTDEIVEAVNLWNRLRTYHAAAGQGLAGMNAANIVSYGHNGSKLADWWGNATWKAEITGSGAHVVILSYGINDFRLGATTQAAFRALLIQAVDYLRASMPTTDIVLRIPNSFTSDNTHAFAAGWVLPATPEAAQKYSTELRNAYLSLIGYWSDGVAVWDAQGRLFGVTSKPWVEGGLMKDILHPSAAKGYPAIADALVSDLIGRDAVPSYVAPNMPAKALLDIVGRADSATAPGIATSGHSYTVTHGAWGVSAHQIYNPNAALGRMIANVGKPDYECGVTLPVNADKATLIFRFADGTNFCYLTNISATSLELFQMVAGTATKIAIVDTTVPANGDRWRVEVDGTMARVYVNNVLKGTYTIPASTAGTSVGLQSTTSTPRFTDLYARPY